MYGVLPWLSLADVAKCLSGRRQFADGSVFSNAPFPLHCYIGGYFSEKPDIGTESALLFMLNAAHQA